MGTPAGTAPGFHRQVIVRVGAEDWSLLEDAVREHGSKQAAILAGLRALRRDRDAPPAPAPAGKPSAAGSGKPKPPSPPSPKPSGDRDDAWWVPATTAAALLGLDTAAALRRRIHDSGAEIRAGDDGEEVRLDQLQVDTNHAAKLTGVAPDTMRARARRGEMGAVERGGHYYFPLGELEIGVAEAAEKLGVSPDTARGRIDRGELWHRRDERGRRRVRLLDVIAGIG